MIHCDTAKYDSVESPIEHESLELNHDIDKRRTELEAELGLSDLQIEIDQKKSDALRETRRKDEDEIDTTETYEVCRRGPGLE